MTTSLIAYATYLPRYRLGQDSGVRGNRVVASFDEDSTTLAVAAGSALLAATDQPLVEQVLLATTTPAYLDKTNASAVHAALGLPSQTFAADLIGSGRSTFAAIRVALTQPTLVVTGDVRVGKPGSVDERSGGDAGAALLFGEGDGIAEVLATTSMTEELLDRWRLPTALTGELWEERFGFERYAALIRATAERVLDEAGLAQADHVALVSPNPAVTKRAGALVKGVRSTRTSPVGYSGAADALAALAAVLDEVGPDQTVLLLSAVDGCDALLLRTTGGLASRRQVRPVAAQLEGGITVGYPTYLSWRGLLERELPRRPEPDRPAGPPSARGVEWKFGFTGSRCTVCGFVHLPPARVCRDCATSDEMEPVRAAGLSGTVATYTVDRLAFSPSPPVVDVVVDFDGGGRCALEVADAAPDSVEIGAKVDLTFRRLFTAGGVHNYFWKAFVLDEGTTDPRRTTP